MNLLMAKTIVSSRGRNILPLTTLKRPNTILRGQGMNRRMFLVGTGGVAAAAALGNGAFAQAPGAATAAPQGPAPNGSIRTRSRDTGASAGS